MPNKFSSLVVGFVLSIFPLICWAETYNDLYERDGIYYKKFTDTPFTGELIDGYVKASFKNGKLHGTYYNFDEKGRMTFRGEYKNGLGHGSFTSYWTDPFTDDGGQLIYKGNERYGKKEGYWEWYHFDGTPDKRYAGTYKNGVKVSD